MFDIQYTLMFLHFDYTNERLLLFRNLENVIVQYSRFSKTIQVISYVICLYCKLIFIHLKVKSIQKTIKLNIKCY